MPSNDDDLVPKDEPTPGLGMQRRSMAFILLAALAMMLSVLNLTTDVSPHTEMVTRFMGSQRSTYDRVYPTDAATPMEIIEDKIVLNGLAMEEDRRNSTTESHGPATRAPSAKPTPTPSVQSTPMTSAKPTNKPSAAPSPKPNQHLDFTKQGSNDGGINYYWTYNTTLPIIPLVDPTEDGQEEINNNTKELIFYKPNVGYSFPLNGQGGKWNNHFYPAQRLHAKLNPGRVLSAQDAHECLRHKRWVHVDGDSLARDIYYDLQELFGLSWSFKAKDLEDMKSDVIDGVPRFTYSTMIPDTIQHIKQAPNWMELRPEMETVKQVACPDIWIYSSGLWDHVAKTTTEFYYNRTKAIADFESNDCVPHKILRYTTPYHNKKLLRRNPTTKEYNRIAKELLEPVGFQSVDTFKILQERSDLSHDGVHYTGPGSKWVTNAILNLACTT